MRSFEAQKSMGMAASCLAFQDVRRLSDLESASTLVQSWLNSRRLVQLLPPQVQQRALILCSPTTAVRSPDGGTGTYQLIFAVANSQKGSYCCLLVMQCLVGSVISSPKCSPCCLLVMQRLVGERDKELRAHALSLKGLTRRLSAAQQARQEAEKLATELLQEHEEGSEGDAEGLPAVPEASAASLGGLTNTCPALFPAHIGAAAHSRGVCCRRW